MNTSPHVGSYYPRFIIAVIMLFTAGGWGCKPSPVNNGGGWIEQLRSISRGPDGNASALGSLTVNVVDETGSPLAGGFRWLVEEDATYQTVPGVAVTESVGTGIHRSHNPVVASGLEATASANVTAPDDRRLFVSVLPVQPGWQMGGAPVAAGQTSVTITVHSPPLPTAQVSVFVFEDKQPLNSAPDLPAEPGLGGFMVIVNEFLGYQMMDAFGNMIGTTYMLNPDGSMMLDADGSPIVDMMGLGYVVTAANGEALIKNLPAGKFGVMVIPPSGTDWVQTSTIEGTPVFDSWVGHNEPPWFAEGGAFSWHVFQGFVHPTVFPAPAGTVGSISGQAVYVHDNRPPLQPGLNPGRPVTDAWVALNNLSGADEVVYAQPCNRADGTFTIPNVPPGTYQLAIFDFPLDAIIDFRTVVMPPAGGDIDVGQVALFGWFGTLMGTVFNDLNENGIPDAGEAGIPGMTINLRAADGSVYKSTATNPMGEYSLTEVFPFFHWLIAEVDFARLKATGATIIVDDGGPLAPGMINNPQPQPENGGLGWRAETGEVLLQAMILMADMTHEIHWGKTDYGPGENGGVSGVTYYATTRAENDPRLAVNEEWEPGVPRVQVALYRDEELNHVIDDFDGDNLPTRADVDNWPFGWLDNPAAKGPEDVDRNNNGTFDPGDAMQIVTTDSWDDNNPTGAVGDPQYVHGNLIRDGAETLRTFNQVRPGVFDGGYAFTSHYPEGIVSGNPEVPGIPTGYYIVEASPPPGYELVKEEDKNVDFGEENIGALALPVLGPPLCVGDDHLVPDQLTLFPGVTTDAAGQYTPLCDLKLVRVREGRNAAADFALFTPVPKAALGWGLVFDDLALEFEPSLPTYGSNLGVRWLPISIQDWTGREITRVYTDEWGKYNVVMPSTYSVNIPAPSGVAPNMLRICLNHPGPIPDPANPGAFIPDPWFNPAYSQPCNNLDFYPGKTTFMDTPILPIAAFTANKTPLDCDQADGVPEIGLVSGPTGGPYVAATGNNLTITSLGATSVHNPDYDPANPLSPAFITRDFGFGAAAGTVTLGTVTLPIVLWNDAVIIATVPAGATTGQLTVTRLNGNSTLTGVTVHVGGPQISEVRAVSAGGSIQDAIDAAADNALILVGPGVYEENLVIYKPVKLQGYGANSTVLKAHHLTPAELATWTTKVQGLIGSGAIEPVPGQRDIFLDQGAGIMVSLPSAAVIDPANPPLIDGLQITEGYLGGGIFVNSYAKDLHISNNKLISNQGNFGGGIRVGTPSTLNLALDAYVGSGNTGLSIHHNTISQNGSLDGGGGVAIFNGSDNYALTDNYICGNFTLLYGGGVAHFGKSDGGLISGNRIISNQSFDEGGGIMIAGELVPPDAPIGTLTEGSGSVTVDANVILGNMAGDDGGGIRTLMTSGQDVEAQPADPGQWHRLDILNNLIVNNVSWDAGGGMSLDDSANIYLINNTIAHNDATSNGIDAFGPCVLNVPPGNNCIAEGGGLINSVPQVGGIASRAHSAGLQGAFGSGFEQTFTDPVMEDNIIYQNRSFYWDAAYNGGLGGLRPDLGGGEAPVYWDLAVYGTPTVETMNPLSGILTSLTYDLPGGGTGNYDASNLASDPLFVDGTYFNTFLATSKGAAIGNFVVVTFKLPGLHGNYHLLAGSPALNLGAGIYLGAYPELGLDVDGQARPFNGGVDAGADELH